MVAEAASEGGSTHRNGALAPDDEGLPRGQEDNNSPMIGEQVTQNPQVNFSNTAPTNRPLAICPPPNAQDVPGTSNDPDDVTGSSYHLKWIPWNSGTVPIVMQSINGPCPLIAIMNVLLLREKIKLPNMIEQITESQLLAYIGESIMDSTPNEAQDNEAILLNLEQNMHDAIEILPKLKTGLDVNIRFTGITDFEYTPECTIFDLLRIPLYHGWLCDPELSELRQAISSRSYNQLVDDIITNKASQDPVVSTRVLLGEEFLKGTASQLTPHGLNELRTTIKDNEIGILFRNNHFLTLLKRDGEIYLLVTDHGYLTEDNIVWETLDSVEGAGRFFDGEFQISGITNRQVSELKAIDERQQQMANDYLIALSLNREETKNATDPNGALAAQLELEDYEVAKRLQAEEDAQYEEAMRKQQGVPANRNAQPSAPVQVSWRAPSEFIGTNETISSQAPANPSVPDLSNRQEQTESATFEIQPATMGTQESTRQHRPESAEVPVTNRGPENVVPGSTQTERRHNEKRESNCVVH